MTVVGAATKSMVPACSAGRMPENWVGVDLDRALHALADLVGEIDVEAFDAAFEVRHGVRRESAVDHGFQRLLSRSPSRASNQSRRRGNKAGFH